MEEAFLSYVAQPVGGMELLAKQVVEGFLTGLHKSPFHGFSVEFAEHRLYNTGDDTRYIDWKLFARTDKLFIKKFNEETNLRCHFLIDTSSSMYFPKNSSPSQPNKLAFSSCAAASLAYLLHKQRDAVSLSTFSDNINFTSPAKSGFYHLRYLFTKFEKLYLDSVEAKLMQETDIAKSLHLIAEQIHKRSLVILFSDMFDKPNTESNFSDLLSALQHLRYKQNEVLMFNVLSREKEALLDYSNRPYLFVDMENGKEVKLNPHHIKQLYNQKMSSQMEQLQRLCEQYKIDFIPAYIEDGFAPVLQSYLSKR